jgi:programmed cell death protein 4
MEIKGRPKDRQSSTGIAGSPKKGGAGGKGTWGVGGLDDLKTVAVADSGDPNYDSEDEETEEVVIAPTVITSPVEVLVKEYLASGDVEETIKSLRELKIENTHEQFVKKAMVHAMEKQAYERELVSKLLSSVYNQAVTADKIAEGFQAALDSLEDIVLDTPDAVEILAKFLARAVIDEVVAPAFFKHAVANSPLAEQCLAGANTLTNQPFRSERLAHIWGAGDLSSVKRLKEEVTLLLEEYLTNGDLHEADKSVRGLNAPHFHPQLVKQALRLALTKGEQEQKQILSLLASFAKSDLISKDHMNKGFGYCIDSLDDLKLDVPSAPSIITGFVRSAKADGWLDKSCEEAKLQ